jgi:hypothetical protein
MALKMRPTGLGAGTDKNRRDYTAAGVANAAASKTAVIIIRVISVFSTWHGRMLDG